MPPSGDQTTLLTGAVRCAETTEVLIRAPEGGLTVDSVVLLDQIRSLDKRRLVRRLGGLKPATMERVEQALLISFGMMDI